MHYTLHSFSLLLLFIIGFVVVDSSTPLSFIEEARTTHPFILEDGPIEGCDGRDFELKCKDNNPVIDIMSKQFRVLQLYPDTGILTVVRTDIVDDGCPDHNKLVNTTLNSDYADQSSENLTFVYNCADGIPDWVQSGSACTGNGNATEGFYFLSLFFF
nr:hypothetical protein CFP56_08427 [Quercus suber]